MKIKAIYNLHSPNRLRSACDSRNLDRWFDGEIEAIDSDPIRDVVRKVVFNLDNFISWPQRAILLWKNCDRIPPPGQKNKYFRYPQQIKRLMVEKGFPLDTRMNGPAISAFLLAGGERPGRFGSSNAWSIHHLYSGKFPHPGKESALHAIKSGLHFTQSAGLIATHPIADALSDEFPFFSWRLRAEAFNRFGYDPDQVFSEDHDSLGFGGGSTSTVIYEDI